jgi:DNA helicase HerA-like ATPase
VREFIIAHPNEIDPRRMDWLWMVDLLSGGLGSLTQITQEEQPQKERSKDVYIDIENNLQFDIDAIAGKSIGILGITRSGKTNTAMVLIEELFANKIPMTIVDIEGEYHTLKDRFGILIAGNSVVSDIPLSLENTFKIAQQSVEQDISVLLDLSDYTDEEECRQILLHYFSAIWNLTTKRRGAPYQIILEEAHEWIPEGQMKTELKTLLTRIALRGRKRGLGLTLISQRSAKVSKDALSQSSLLFLHKSNSSRRPHNL